MARAVEHHRLPEAAGEPGVGDGVAAVAVDSACEHLDARGTVVRVESVMEVLAAQQVVVRIEAFGRCFPGAGDLHRLHAAG